MGAGCCRQHVSLAQARRSSRMRSSPLQPWRAMLSVEECVSRRERQGHAPRRDAKGSSRRLQASSRARWVLARELNFCGALVRLHSPRQPRLQLCDMISDMFFSESYLHSRRSYLEKSRAGREKPPLFGIIDGLLVRTQRALYRAGHNPVI